MDNNNFIEQLTESRHDKFSKAAGFMNDVYDSAIDGKTIGKSVVDATMKSNVYLRAVDMVTQVTDFTQKEHIREKMVNDSFQTLKSDPVKSEREWNEARRLIILEDASKVVNYVKDIASNVIDNTIEYIGNNMDNITDFMAKSHQYNTGMHIEDDKIHMTGVLGHCYTIGLDKHNTKPDQIGELIDKEYNNTEIIIDKSETNNTRQIRRTENKQEPIQRTENKIESYENNKKSTEKKEEPVKKVQEIIKKKSVTDELISKCSADIEPNIYDPKKSSVNIGSGIDNTSFSANIVPTNIKQSSITVTEKIDNCGIGMTIQPKLKNSSINISGRVSDNCSLSTSINVSNPLKSQVGGSATVPVYGIPINFSFSMSIRNPLNAQLAVSLPKIVPGIGHIKLVSLDVKKIKRKIGRAFGFGHKKKNKKKHKMQMAILNQETHNLHTYNQIINAIANARIPSIMEDYDIINESKNLREEMERTLENLNHPINVLSINTNHLPINSISNASIENYNDSNNNFTNSLAEFGRYMENEIRQLEILIR